MTVAITIYDTSTLIAVITQVEPVQSYWLDLCFPQEQHFDDEYIDFEKISDVRRIAPFVAPLAQGQPIYSEGSVITRLKPAYIKPKDPVGPTRALKRRPGALMDPSRGGTQLSRYNAIVADIARAHRAAIERRWEWMAARAVIDASITIVGEAYPERVVNFGRNGNQTVVLSGGALWGQTGVSIVSFLETMRTRMRRALFGGAPNRVTMGADVWDVMRQDAEIRELLKLDLRPYNGGININLGMKSGLEVEQVASFGGLDFYVYSDYYQDPVDGSQVNFMSPKDIVMTGPNLQGVRAFAAILDPNANFAPVSIFPRQFRSDDPPVLFIMTQSAPLMVPVNPNASLKATVVA